jgi:hypothetical protein
MDSRSRLEAYADRYLGEFALQWNYHQIGDAMFDLLFAAL